MNTAKVALFAGAAVIIAGGLVLAIKMNPTPSNGQGTIGAPVQSNVALDKVDPYTHVAFLPATVDPASIRFEKLKMVDVASKTSTTLDAQRCKDLQFREPDGSGCQTTKVEERVKALEATYSFNAPEIATGESIPGRDTFSVYFRPQEVAVDGPVDKLKRDQAAAMFRLTTYRPMTEQKVIDKQNSHYCDGSYLDGNWVRTDPGCKDQVQFISQTVPSPTLTVQVDVR